MIKEYRIKAGYTQEELAEILDISTRQLQRIEANVNNTKIKTLKSIISVLKVEDKDIIKILKDKK